MSVQLPMLNWDAPDLKIAVQEWKTLLNSYIEIQSVANEKRWHYILLSSGSRGHELGSSWTLTDDEKKNPVTVFKKYEDHLIGTVNKWVSRLEFSSLIQKDSETVDDFICRLQAKASLCEFSANTRTETSLSS